MLEVGAETGVFPARARGRIGVVTWREVRARLGVLLQELRFVSIPQAVPGCPPTVGPWERELAAEAFTHGKTQEMGSLGS